MYSYFKDNDEDIEMKEFFSYEKFASFETRIKELEKLIDRMANVDS
jgi:exonuclease VII small subunit